MRLFTKQPHTGTAELHSDTSASVTIGKRTREITAEDLPDLRSRVMADLLASAQKASKTIEVTIVDIDAREHHVMVHADATVTDAEDEASEDLDRIDPGDTSTADPAPVGSQPVPNTWPSKAVDTADEIDDETTLWDATTAKPDLAGTSPVPGAWNVPVKDPEDRSPGPNEDAADAADDPAPEKTTEGKPSRWFKPVDLEKKAQNRAKRREALTKMKGQRLTRAGWTAVAGAIVFMIVVALVGMAIHTRLTAAPESSGPATPPAPIPGYSGTATATFEPIDNTSVTLSSDGSRVAAISDDQAVSIQPISTVDAGKTPTGPEAKQTLSGTVTGLHPLGADGFAATATIDKRTSITTWTPSAGFTTFKLDADDHIATQSGTMWVTHSGKPVQLVTASGLVTYKDPKNTMHRTFVGFNGSTAIWEVTSPVRETVKVEKKEKGKGKGKGKTKTETKVKTTPSAAQVATTTQDGKDLSRKDLAAPEKNSTPARWITSTSDRVLICWKTKTGYVLAIHDTSTGEVTAKTRYELPTGTKDPKQIDVRTSTDGTIAVVGPTWVDVSAGNFTKPTHIGNDLASIQFVPGGYLTKSRFIRTDGTVLPEPNHGRVIGLSAEAVLIEGKEHVKVYPATTGRKGGTS